MEHCEQNKEEVTQVLKDVAWSIFMQGASVDEVKDAVNKAVLETFEWLERR